MAPLTAVQLTVALLEVTDAEARPVGAVHGINVVNCAAAGVLIPDAHVAVTLQSYKELEVSPVISAVVAVCVVEKLVQVDDEFSL